MSSRATTQDKASNRYKFQCKQGSAQRTSAAAAAEAIQHREAAEHLPPAQAVQLVVQERMLFAQAR